MTMQTIEAKDYKRVVDGQFFNVFTDGKIDLHEYPVHLIDYVCDLVESDLPVSSVQPFSLPNFDLTRPPLMLLFEADSGLHDHLKRHSLADLVRLVQLTEHLGFEFGTSLAMLAVNLALVSGQTLESKTDLSKTDWLRIGRSKIDWKTYVEVAKVLPFMHAAPAMVNNPPADLSPWNLEKLQNVFELAVKKGDVKLVDRLLERGCVWTKSAVEKMANQKLDPLLRVWTKYMPLLPPELLTGVKLIRLREVIVAHGDSAQVDIKALVKSRDWITISMAMRRLKCAKKWVDDPELMAVPEFYFLAQSLLQDEPVEHEHPILQWCVFPEHLDSDSAKHVADAIDFGPGVETLLGWPEALKPDEREMTPNHCRWTFENGEASPELAWSMAYYGLVPEFVEKHGLPKLLELLKDCFHRKCLHSDMHDRTELGCWVTHCDYVNQVRTNLITALVSFPELEFKDIKPLLKYNMSLTAKHALVLRFPNELPRTDPEIVRLLDLARPSRKRKAGAELDSSPKRNKASC